MPTTVDLNSVESQRTQINTQLEWQKSLLGDPTGSIALGEKMNAWSAVAPNAPAGVLASFATAGIAPDSELGSWLVKQGVSQLSSQDVVRDTPTRMTRANATSQLLGNPDAIKYLSTLPMEQVAKMNPADLGAWMSDPQAFQRVLEGKSAIHHASFMEHVGSALSPVTQGITAAFAFPMEAINAAQRVHQSLPSADTATAFQAAQSGAVGKEGQGRIAGGPADLPGPFGTTVHIGGTDQPLMDMLNQTMVGQQVFHGKNYGAGLFAAGTAKEAAVKAQQASESLISKDHTVHAWTLGRGTGALITQPGTLPYNVISGAVDFTVAMKGDPTILLGNELQKAWKGARLLAPSGDEALATAADHLMSQDPLTLSKIRTWTGSMSSDLRQAVIDKLTKEPGSLQTLVEQGVIDKHDVASAIGRRYAGAIPGLRPMLDQPTALTWLNQGAGRHFVNFATDSGFTDIWKATKGKIPVDIVAKLAETKDPAEVRSILGSAMSDATIRETPNVGLKYSGIAPFSWAKPLDANRYFNFLPRGAVHVTDNDGAVDSAYRTLTQLHAGIPAIGKALVPKSEWDAILSNIASARGGPDMFHAYVDGLGGAVEKALTEHGVDETLANKLTRFFPKTWESDKIYAIDSAGNTPHIPGIFVDGNAIPMEGPFYWNQLLNSVIPPLDVKDIGRNIGGWGKLWNTPVVGPTIQGADYVASHITQAFKIGVLAKLALPVRFLADEQARMATAGFDSMFHHPISYIAWALGGRQGADAEFMRALAEHPFATAIAHPAHTVSQLGVSGVAGGFEKAIEAKGMTDILGKAFTDAHAARAYDMSRALGGMARTQGIDTGAIFAKHWDVVPRESDKYLKGWWDELSQLHLDPVTRETAKALLDANHVPAGLETAGIDGVKQWLFEGGGAKYNEDLATANLWRGESAAMTTNPQVSGAYIDAVRQQILDKTGSDPMLINAIANGDPFRANALMPELKRDLQRAMNAQDHEAVDAIRQRMKDATDVRKKLEDMRFRGNDNMGNPMPAGPDKVRSAVFDPTNMGRGVLDKMVDKMFSALMDVPSKQLTRSSVFRQAYWQRMDEMLPFMDAKTAAQARIVAEHEGVALKNAAGTTGLLDSADKADTIAKSFALKTTHDLLYYPSERSGIMARLNIVLPFGEAWKNVLTSWAKLAAENPVTVTRRVQQGVVDSRGSGWWYTDPQDGVEKFTLVPGSVMQHLAGVPFDMTAQVKGLNIVGSGLPGVGPAIQIPAAQILSAFHNVPALDKFRQMVLPYGSPDFTGGTMELLFPGWIDKLRQTGWFNHIPFGGQSENQKRVLDNVVKEVMQYKLSAGHWDLSNPDDALRLEHESMHDAQMLYLWRGLAQSVAPAAPSFKQVTKLKDGGLIETWLLAQDYRAMIAQNAGDSYAATRAFISKYGVERVFATQALSQPTVYGIPTTAQGKVWQSQHPDFAAKYHNVFGYWAPQGGAFDYNAYLDNIANGDTKALKPNEWLGLAEARVGNAAYDQLRRQLPSNPSDAQQQWLANAKVKIGEQFPGFADDSLKVSRKTPAQTIAELAQAVSDPTVSSTPLAHAAVVYMDLRRQALAEAQRRGYASLSGSQVADLRNWLMSAGGKIATDMPQFQTIWDNLFRPEVESHV